MRALLLSTLPLLLSACVVHSQTGEGTEANEADKPDAPAAEEGAAAEGGARSGACSIPEGMTPAKPALAMPQIAAPEDVSFEREAAMLEVDENGKVKVSFEFSARNNASEAVELAVGFAWRIQETGGGGTSLSGFEIVGGRGELERCTIQGPEEMQQPFRDELLIVRISVEPGKTETIKGAYVGEVDQADKPQTLFGFHDRFVHNWKNKNWDWPYTKRKAYAEIKDELKPFHGRFGLGKAGRSQITIRSSKGEVWMRTMSHEQVTEKLRIPGTFRWSFWGGDKPAQVEFEYMPGVELMREIEVFRKIIKENRYDLRARIRLADLAGFAGDHEARVSILEALLKYWKKHHKEQMLHDANDVRGAAYVALVKSLLAIDEKGEAARRADEGIGVIKKLEEAGHDSEMNRMAREWLEKQL